LRRFLGARALAEGDVELEPEQRPRQRPGPSVPSKIWKKSTDRFTTTSTLTPSSARTRVILTAKDAEAWDTDELTAEGAEDAKALRFNWLRSHSDPDRPISKSGSSQGLAVQFQPFPIRIRLGVFGVLGG